MIRTLATLAGLSFILAVACFAGAVAIAGGPFNIDENLRFHRVATPIDNPCLPTVTRELVRHAV
jgi:hypothetical protein